MADPVWYLYCIAGGECPPAPGAGLEMVSHGDLHAVLRPVAPDLFTGLAPDPDGQLPRRLEELLVQHDQVVRAVFARQPVLPLRFGTALAGPGAVLNLLAGRHDELRQQLDRVRGHAEWGVKWQRPAETAPAAEPEPGGGTGLGYLQKRSRELQAARETARRYREMVCRHHGQLAAMATESMMGEDGCAYLVRFDREAEFCALAAQPGARVTGPWPPYSFCTERSRPEPVPWR